MATAAAAEPRKLFPLQPWREKKSEKRDRRRKPRSTPLYSSEPSSPTSESDREDDGESTKAQMRELLRRLEKLETSVTDKTRGPGELCSPPLPLPAPPIPIQAPATPSPFPSSSRYLFMEGGGRGGGGGMSGISANLPPGNSSDDAGGSECVLKSSANLPFKDSCNSLSEENPIQRWRGILRDAIIEGEFIPSDLSAFPVLVDGEGNKIWQALDWKMLKEAKAAISQYGLKSGYTTSVLQHVFTSSLLTPFDTKMAVTTLLSPHQQLQFYQKWQTACDTASAVPRQQGDPLFGVTSQMLMGTPPFARPEWQARFATEVLHLSQELAYKAMQAVQDDKSAPAFTSVKQGPTEPFGKFIDRLHHAINSNPDLDETMKVKFMDTLAYSNANEKTRQALSVLPRGATTGQLLEAADRMMQQENAAYIASAESPALLHYPHSQSSEMWGVSHWQQ